MNESTKTKKAFRGSLFALFLCIVLLIGTTFAWFTDSVSTGVNKIQAGNLKVQLEYSTDMETWKTATSSTKLFNDNTLWEPGVTEVVYLRVKNAGNLAMKYTARVNPYVNSSRGKNVNNEFFYISDYLKSGIAATNNKFGTREEAQTAIAGNVETLANAKFFDSTIVAPGEWSNPIALVIYMPTDVGNEANAKDSSSLSYVYNLGVEVYASQAASEYDSFDNTYDEKAPDLLKAESASYGTHEITKNIQANGRFGAVQAEDNAQFIINANVYAVYAKSGDVGGAMAVKASDTSNVIINGGDFRQFGVPANDTICDLIYAMDSATIEINGGTFKAVDPTRTLNCFDGSSAKITVKGGSFYKYDPSHPTLGDNEVVVADGYKVVQDGDWYKVVEK